MKIRCGNPKCLYQWDYKGVNPFYATCPMCMRKVSLSEYKKEGEEPKHG